MNNTMLTFNEWKLTKFRNFLAQQNPSLYFVFAGGVILTDDIPAITIGEEYYTPEQKNQLWETWDRYDPISNSLFP